MSTRSWEMRHRLAQQMQQRQITEFYLEQLQRSWLPTKRAQGLYPWLFGLVFGLFIGLKFGLVWALFLVLIFGVFCELYYGDRGSCNRPGWCGCG